MDDNVMQTVTVDTTLSSMTSCLRWKIDNTDLLVRTKSTEHKSDITDKSLEG